MQRTKRHRPFIADLASQGVGPREPYMMRLARHPPADEAGPRGHRARMLFVPNAFGGGKGEDLSIWPSCRAGVGSSFSVL